MKSKSGQRVRKVIGFFCLLISIVLIISGLFLRAWENPLQWTITLRIYPTAINFPAADPDLEPVVVANTSIKVEVDTWPPKRRWQLFIRAEGNLVSAEGQVIPINNISWKAAPQPPFRDGVLEAGQNLVLAANGRGRQEGEILFSFQNSWNYVAGEYTQTITLIASLL